MSETTTAPIQSQRRSAELLLDYSNRHLSVSVLDDDTFTVTFADLDQAIKAVESIKQAAFSAYVRNGGNPRNKRSFGSQFASIKRAMVAAAD